jgi:transposase
MTQMARQIEDTTKRAELYLSIELSSSQWKMTLTDGSRLRERNVDAGNVEEVEREIGRAKEKLELPKDCAVHSCYEAGRDGFWLHRELTKRGVDNLVVDPSAIETSRRLRQVKTDRVDGRKLVAQLVRYQRGEHGALRAVRVPSAEAEDARRPERERKRLQSERTGHRNRMGALLVLHGVRLQLSLKPTVEQFAATLEQHPTPTGEQLPPGLRAELVREYERLQGVQKQLRQIDSEIAAWRKAQKHPWTKKMDCLAQLRGIGDKSSDMLVRESFGWRTFENRRQLASAAGLAPTPFASGTVDREQGISKAGSARIRSLMVELAWIWLRRQPDSQLSRWFHERFGKSGKRSRRVGIVALARKLLIALWRYLEQGVIPEGALLKD